MMCNEPLVSIIIPAYNVENYIRRCVESVLKQTYRKIEVILVDDGSTDKSGNICELYKASDERVVVIHKVNGGLSDARNCGLEVAKGDYIFFLDGDDWIRIDCIQTLISYALDTNADVVISKYISVSESETSKKQRINNSKSILILNKEKALEALLYQKLFSTSACGKLYKSFIIREKKFPVGKLFEDVETIFRVIEDSDCVAVIDEVLYYYFKRSNSITKCKFDIKKMDYVEACENVYSYVYKKYPDLKDAAMSRLVWSEIYILVHLDDCTKYKNIYQHIWLHIKNNRMLVIRNKSCALKCRLVCVLSFFGDKILRFIFKLVK